jgi:hypothetical protein
MQQVEVVVETAEGVAAGEGDGGTSKRKPRRTGNKKQRSNDENDEEDQVSQANTCHYP